MSVEKYEWYIDPASGVATEATASQKENESDQVLCITGIEAIFRPPIWVGPYNGEMLFASPAFESLNNGKLLQIKISDTIVTGIENPSPNLYSITFRQKDQVLKKEFDSVSVGLKSLATIK